MKRARGFIWESTDYEAERLGLVASQFSEVFL